MTNVEIIVDGPIPKDATIIEGFQGIGLVGTLTAQYLADQTNAKLIGYLNVPDLPPIALLVDGQIRNPIRIYSFKKSNHDFILFESELPIPQKLVNPIAMAIAEFAKKNKAKEIISFEGLTVPKSPEESNNYWISNMDKKFSNFKKHAEPLKTGIVIGVSAGLLIQAKMKKIPAIVLLAEAHSDFPDGMAAASIIKLLNKVFKFNVDVTPLEKESKKFEEKVWKVVEQARQLKESDNKPGKTYIG